MIRYAVFAALAAVPSFVASSQVRPAHPSIRCTEVWGSEPVLVYDVAGSTLTGPVSRHLVVYSDGRATLADWNPAIDPGRVGVVGIHPVLVEQLRRDLSLAGAFEACDDPTVVTDVPLTTVTVFEPGASSRSRTFSYLIPGPGVGNSHQVIQLLIANHFPGF